MYYNPASRFKFDFTISKYEKGKSPIYSHPIFNQKKIELDEEGKLTAYYLKQADNSLYIGLENIAKEKLHLKFVSYGLAAKDGPYKGRSNFPFEINKNERKVFHVEPYAKDYSITFKKIEESDDDKIIDEFLKDVNEAFKLYGNALDSKGIKEYRYKKNDDTYIIGVENNSSEEREVIYSFTGYVEDMGGKKNDQNKIKLKIGRNKRVAFRVKKIKDYNGKPKITYKVIK